MGSVDALPPLLTMAQVAELTGFSRRSVRRMVANGVLPSIKLTRSVRVPTSDLLAVLDENRRSRERARIESDHVDARSSVSPAVR